MDTFDTSFFEDIPSHIDPELLCQDEEGLDSDAESGGSPAPLTRNSSCSDLLDSDNDSRKRRRLTPEETRSLLQVFEFNQKPNAETRQRLAKQLGMTSRNIQIWFQNRRAKGKRDVFDGDKKNSQQQIAYQQFYTKEMLMHMNQKMPQIAPAPQSYRMPMMMTPYGMMPVHIRQQMVPQQMPIARPPQQAVQANVSREQIYQQEYHTKPFTNEMLAGKEHKILSSQLSPKETRRVMVQHVQEVTPPSKMAESNLHDEMGLSSLFGMSELIPSASSIFLDNSFEITAIPLGKKKSNEMLGIAEEEDEMNATMPSKKKRSELSL